MITKIGHYEILQASGGGDLEIRLNDITSWFTPIECHKLLGDAYFHNSKIARAIDEDYEDAMDQCSGDL